jgi:hypothetical protein
VVYACFAFNFVLERLVPALRERPLGGLSPANIG